MSGIDFLQLAFLFDFKNIKLVHKKEFFISNYET